MSNAPAGSPGRGLDRPWLPLAAVAATLLMWASAFVAIRHLGRTVPPGSMSLARLAVAVLALGVMVRAGDGLRGRGLRTPTRQEWPLVLLGGATWIGVYNLALNEAGRRIDAATSALLVQVGPILVAAFAVLLLHEPASRWLVAGLTVGFAGVTVIARASADNPEGDVVGVLLGLVAAITFAVGVLTQKRLLGSGMTALEMTFWYYVVGLVVCLPWTVELVDVVAAASAADLWWLVYLGVFPSAIAFTTWAFALSRSHASSFAMATFLVPFITALMAWALLGEVPPVLTFVGGTMCLAGVLLARRPSRPGTGDPPDPPKRAREDPAPAPGS